MGSRRSAPVALGSRLRRAALPPRWQRPVRLGLFGVALIVGLTLILTLQFLPSRFDLNVGDVSVYTIKSPQRVTFVSQELTRQRRQEAAAAVTDVYAFQTSIIESQRRVLGDALRQIDDVRRTLTSRDEKRSAIVQIPNLALPSAVVDDLIDLNETTWRGVITESLRVFDRAMLNRITDAQLEDARNGIAALVDPALSSREATIIASITRQFIQPNYVIDTEATDSARRRAAESVEPVRITIERGETILRDGQIVTALDLEELEAAGLRNPTIRWADLLGIFLMVLALVLPFCLYVHQMRPSLMDQPGRLVLIVLLLILTPLAAKLIVAGRDVNTIYAYLFPTAAVAITLAVLADTGAAIVAVFLLGSTLGMISTTSFEITLMTLVSCLVGIIGVHHMDRISTLFRTSVVVAVVNMAMAVGFQLAAGEVDNQRLLVLAFSGLVNGVLVGLVALGLISFLGHIFGITTTMSLLELAHPSQPLFRRLLSEAPGTYHHSVVVANLAERAAELLGADTLLVRIGAYYHDIGKLVRPYAFSENQVDGQNIHDQLDPHTSVQLIIAHVTDGIELSRRHALPHAIRDLIAQHHGTDLVKYFYHQACRAADQPVDEEAFRYPGPRPQTREAAILMLADSVEATIRSSRDHSIEHIRAVVDQIMQERLEDHQLDECDLTFRDLSQIRHAFVAVLQSIYHPRIEYPRPPALLRPPAEHAHTR